MDRADRPRERSNAFVDLASNDYLGLLRHPDVKAGAVAALHRWGTRSSGAGTTTDHEALESDLAEFVGGESGLIFSSGGAALRTTVTALSGVRSLVVSDSGSYPSVVDACRRSRARVAVTPHGDIGAVNRALTHRAEHQAVVVTDSVFGVDGDLAPLIELHRVTRARGALLVVDESHGIGVRGDGGRGFVHEVGLAGAPGLVVTTTLSNALAASGGAVVSSAAVREQLIAHAATDSAPAHTAVGAARAALDVIRREPELVASVRERAAELARIVGTPTPESAIVPVMIGDPQQAVDAAQRCRDRRVEVGCILPPSVSGGTSRLRLAARANLSDDEVRRIDDVLTEVFAITNTRRCS